MRGEADADADAGDWALARGSRVAPAAVALSGASTSTSSRVPGSAPVSDASASVRIASPAACWMPGSATAA
ncbi:hypothetical protein BGV62_12810 [Burkholderia ubonensis]|nr:hypothetical protein BGV62_12810 [Burkholderia ubonensis]